MAKARTFVIDLTENSLEGKNVSQIKITISIIKGIGCPLMVRQHLVADLFLLLLEQRACLG